MAIWGPDNNKGKDEMLLPIALFLDLFLTEFQPFKGKHATNINNKN